MEIGQLGNESVKMNPIDTAPDPKTIFEIGNGTAAGNQFAAIESFRQLGEVEGDALANALCLIDGLAVIGGGVSGVWPLFLSTVVAEMNGRFTDPNGTGFKRLSQTAFNLEDPDQLADFLKGDQREINVPGSDRTLMYEPTPRIGVGMARLGTSEAGASVRLPMR